MKIIENIFMGIIFLIGYFSYCQESSSFYVEIPNLNNVPKVTHDKNGIRKTYSKTNNSALNKLLNSYEIYRCEKVFENSNASELQNIYYIECNDLKLMNELFENFKNFYPRAENANTEELAIPNDYGMTGGYTATNQEELNYIRAPEAWDITTGSSDIIIGIADSNYTPNHEDLLNTLEVVEGNNYVNAGQHGSRVAGFAAANTNNNKGISAIGYDSYIYAAAGGTYTNLDKLSLYDGVKVLNASWGTSSSIPPTISNSTIDEIVDDRGVVVVAAAGNGNYFTPSDSTTDYWFPASHKNVISVSSIGHEDKTFFWLTQSFFDRHEVITNNEIRSHQHNDSIDIVAPGYSMTSINPDNGGGLNAYNNSKTGTSYAAPIVAGTVALMFDANYCIDPKEVETILKLTAVKIDNLPQNIQYYGKLGAGKLDAYEAVKMAKDMADSFGTVEVKDRILYRPWFYKLETAPYEIKMTNNDVTGGSKLKFKARNNIEILSGDYYPSTGGYIDLSIDETLALDCPPPPTNSARSSSKKSKNQSSPIQNEVLNRNTGFIVFPNPTVKFINIAHKENFNEVYITDITGKVVYSINGVNSKAFKINMSKFNSGIYFLKIKMISGEVISTKVIKN